MSWFLAEFPLIFLPICYFRVDFEDLGQFYFVCLFFILGGKVASKEKCPDFRSPEVDIYITMDFGL